MTPGHFGTHLGFDNQAGVPSQLYSVLETGLFEWRAFTSYYRITVEDLWNRPERANQHRSARA